MATSITGVNTVNVNSAVTSKGIAPALSAKEQKAQAALLAKQQAVVVDVTALAKKSLNDPLSAINSAASQKALAASAVSSAMVSDVQKTLKEVVAQQNVLARSGSATLDQGTLQAMASAAKSSTAVKAMLISAPTATNSAAGKAAAVARGAAVNFTAAQSAGAAFASSKAYVAADTGSKVVSEELVKDVTVRMETFLKQQKALVAAGVGNFSKAQFQTVEKLWQGGGSNLVENALRSEKLDINSADFQLAVIAREFGKGAVDSIKARRGASVEALSEEAFAGVDKGAFQEVFKLLSENARLDLAGSAGMLEATQDVAMEASGEVAYVSASALDVLNDQKMGLDYARETGGDIDSVAQHLEKAKSSDPLSAEYVGGAKLRELALRTLEVVKSGGTVAVAFNMESLTDDFLARLKASLAAEQSAAEDGDTRIGGLTREGVQRAVEGAAAFAGDADKARELLMKPITDASDRDYAASAALHRFARTLIGRPVAASEVSDALVKSVRESLSLGLGGTVARLAGDSRLDLANEEVIGLEAYAKESLGASLGASTSLFAQARDLSITYGRGAVETLAEIGKVGVFDAKSADAKIRDILSMKDPGGDSSMRGLWSAMQAFANQSLTGELASSTGTNVVKDAAYVDYESKGYLMDSAFVEDVVKRALSEASKVNGLSAAAKNVLASAEQELKSGYGWNDAKILREALVMSKEVWVSTGSGGRFAVKTADLAEGSISRLSPLRSFAKSTTKESDFGMGDLWDLVQNAASSITSARGTGSSVKASAPVSSYAGMTQENKTDFSKRVGEALLNVYSSTLDGNNASANAAWNGYHLGTRTAMIIARNNQVNAGGGYNLDPRGEVNMRALADKYLSRSASQVTAGEQELWNLVHGLGGQIAANDAQELAEKQANAAAAAAAAAAAQAALANATKPVATSSAALTAAKTSTAAAGASVVSASTAASSAAVKAAVSKAPTAASLTAAAAASTAKTVLGTASVVSKTSVIGGTKSVS